MTGAELLVGAGALAGKVALKKVIDALCKNSSEKVKGPLRSLRTEQQIGKLLKQLSKIRMVKTLGQLDQAVDLMDFYCDSHVYKRNRREKVLSLSDLRITGNILIEGIAGQGKSIFLRYLCAVETMKGEWLPIFAELRKVQEMESLSDFIIRTLKTFHIDATDATLSELINSGKFLLMLDAFDEVRDDSKSRMLEQIENLVAEHENLKVVITSRPESGLSVCPTFEVARLSNLESDEWEIVVDKVTESTEVAQELIKQVKNHKGGIQGLLLTPLLVTLLVIRYKSYQELPEQLADFYDSLFQVLLQRHDGIKPGYRRSRRCVMNDQEYRHCFDSFCFFSKQFQELQLKESDVYDTAKSALKDNAITDDPTGFVSDIVKITCLLVKDGEEYRFIHKSVQEYYAASFIRRKSEIVAAKLYAHLFEDKNHRRFNQELRFLEEMDSYRFDKYVVLPYMQTLFSEEESAFLKKPTQRHIAVIRALFQEFSVGFSVVKDNRIQLNTLRWPNVGPFMHNVEKPLHSLLLGKEFTAMCVEYSKQINTPEVPMTVGENIAGDTPKAQQLFSAASETIADILFKRTREAIANVEKNEAFVSVTKLFT